MAIDLPQLGWLPIDAVFDTASVLDILATELEEADAAERVRSFTEWARNEASKSGAARIH